MLSIRHIQTPAGTGRVCLHHIMLMTDQHEIAMSKGNG